MRDKQTTGIGYNLDHARHGAEIYRDASSLKELLSLALQPLGLAKPDQKSFFANVIKPGQSVLLKPNWVLHYNKSGQGMDCMITHPSFLLTVLQEVVKAKPAKIVIADAPVQGCHLEEILTEDFLERVADCCGDIPFEIIDFRRTTVRDFDLSSAVSTDRRPESNYLLFDLGVDSMLDPISQPQGRFRVTQYDPELLARKHRPGRHQFLVAREVMEADVVINLPKLKTHVKSGITGSLKNLVGINGNKDYLPHHRVGGSQMGGDCYPGRSVTKRGFEALLDRRNHHIGQPLRFRLFNRALFEYHRITSRYGAPIGQSIEGNWHGNDTIWRTVLDLNRILLYGTLQASMAETIQRNVLHITDAIVCGQHNGPLSPEPASVGAITASFSSVAAETANAALLRMDYKRIPLIREAFGQFKWPLTEPNPNLRYVLNGEAIDYRELANKAGVNALTPDGWTGSMELLT